jgi:integrase
MPATSRPTNGGLQVPSGPPVWAIVASYPKSTTPHPKAPAPNYQPPINPPQIDRPDPRLSALHAENQHLRAQLAAAQDALKLAACQAEAMRGLVGMLQQIGKDSGLTQGGEGAPMGAVTPPMNNQLTIVGSIEGPESIPSAVEAWGRDMARRGCRAQSFARYKEAVEKCAAHAGWSTVTDINLAGAIDYLGVMREGRWGGTTHDWNASALRSFSKFLHKTERLEANVLEHLESCGDPGEPGSRALTTDEVRAIVKAAHERARYDKRARGNAALYYAFLCKTGLRAAEAAKIRWKDIDLHGAPPAIYTDPSWAKNRKRQRVVLNAELVALLVEHRKTVIDRPDSRIFPQCPNRHTWQKDREAAGIKRTDARNRDATMHSCRKWLDTELDRLGVAIGVRRRIIRHAGGIDDRYLDPQAEAETLAVSQLPNIWPTDAKNNLIGTAKSVAGGLDRRYSSLVTTSEPEPMHATTLQPSDRNDRPAGLLGVVTITQSRIAGRSFPSDTDVAFAGSSRSLASEFGTSAGHGSGHCAAQIACSTHGAGAFASEYPARVTRPEARPTFTSPATPDSLPAVAHEHSAPFTPQGTLSAGVGAEFESAPHAGYVNDRHPSTATTDVLAAVAHPLPPGSQAPEAGFTTSDKEQTWTSPFTRHSPSNCPIQRDLSAGCSSGSIQPSGACAPTLTTHERLPRKQHANLRATAATPSPSSTSPPPPNHTPHPSSAQEAGGISPGARADCAREDRPLALYPVGAAAPLTQRMEMSDGTLASRPCAGVSERDGREPSAIQHVRSDAGSRGVADGEGTTPGPALNPDGDPITMMTAQERRDTLALIRRLLFPAIVLLGTCAAAAAMNSTYEKPPVTIAEN